MRPTFRIAAFALLALAVPGRVEVIQGTTEGLAITADDNVLPQIETVVETGVLKIRFRNRFGTISDTHIRIAVNAKQLETLAIAGSGAVHIPALATPRLAVSIAGSGDVTVAGRADELEVKISGSGDLKAAKLETRSAAITIAGSGDVTVWASQALKAKVAGSGDIRYYGDPSIEQRIVGSGSVKRMGAAPA